MTSDRIIARVTDGIYREPWSAFRELVSNAYDADATTVSIDTDYPFFQEIKVTDNGNGMSSKTLAHLLENIGGSSKRTAAGKELGTVASSDPTKSPGGRKLIGKIGIGLFAVAQLTNKFQIISRTKGKKELVSATISIHSYKENDLIDDDAPETSSGSYMVHAEVDPDVDAHGTTIVLYSILPAVRRKLQSADMWETIAEQTGDATLGEIEILRPPSYHIGQVGPNERIVTHPVLPWLSEDSPDLKFKKLFKAAVEEKASIREQKDLSHLDSYLEMIWRLSLSAPLPYIGEHPFGIKGSANMRFFELSNKPKGSAVALDVRPERTVGHVFGLMENKLHTDEDFSILVDSVSLKRPVFISDELQGSKDLEKPMIFVGKSKSIFKGVDENRTGGELSFEAYLYWNSKIVPKESIGALVRVNGASGTLFDPEFLSYKISEQTRKRQITCEIFVHQGLDGAINIDRESFNSSHPHYLYIQKWLHNAFRQFATQHKKVGRQHREAKAADLSASLEKAKERHIKKVWEERRGTNFAIPTPKIVEDKSQGVFSTMVAETKISWPANEDRDAVDFDWETSFATVLEAYGVLDNLSPVDRASLISDLIKLVQDMP